MDVVVVSKAGNYRNSLVALVKSAPNVGRVFVMEGIGRLEEIPMQATPGFVLMDATAAKGELGFWLDAVQARWPLARRVLLADRIDYSGKRNLDGVGEIMSKSISAGEFYQLFRQSAISDACGMD